VTDELALVVYGIIIGIAATAVLDAWIALLKRAFDMPSRSWALVGRWVGHFRYGRFVHESIAKAAPIRHELALGWVFHYFVGALYGLLLVAIGGIAWARNPTLLPALIVSLLMLAAPFFLMDPAMGGGFAASKSPNPTAARLRGLMNHTVFGAALYGAARLAALLLP
jgi:hypothetical protein